MALFFRSVNLSRVLNCRSVARLKLNCRRSFTRSEYDLNRSYYIKLFGGFTVGTITWIAYSSVSTVEAFKNKKKEKEEEFSKDLKLTNRERHFIKFASVEVNGQIYMTPQDFLESFVEEEPRPRLKRRSLTAKEIEDVKNLTPLLKKGSSQLFRSLRDKGSMNTACSFCACSKMFSINILSVVLNILSQYHGLISYTEYLFLLSILTKPQTGFMIAFNMFDTDGNKRVDKEEFLVILHLLSGDVRNRAEISESMKIALMKSSLNAENPEKNMVREQDRNIVYYAMEKIFSHAWVDKHGGNVAIDSEDNLNSKNAKGQSLQRKNLVDTTLLIHFFGKRGNVSLQYEDFRRFMENLQTEVLEMEFQEFAKGANTISELDFAKILLRYTHLDTKVCDMYLNRLLNRLKELDGIPPGITFQEFKVFCQFLNHLEDFTIAMRMYTLADHPISKDEFHRAVKICTGASLSRHLVQTVFAIFDEDGDGQLSYREFIAIMKDRLHRGFKSHVKAEGWEGFKQCIKQEIKTPVAR